MNNKKEMPRVAMASGNGWKLARAHASDDEDSTVRAGMGLGKALPNGGGIKLTTKKWVKAS